MDLQHYPAGCASKLHHKELHPALSEEHYLGPDIYEGLFSVFEEEAFSYWQRSDAGKENWELRCSGAPGLGKTTFAALAAKRLRNLPSGPSQRNTVASVFIVEDVRSSEATFIEDFLGSVFGQLHAGHTCQYKKECKVNRAVVRYVDACQSGQEGTARIQLIREALDACLETLDRAFLVVDGVDRCSPAVKLEDELPRLREKGLKVLTTSRIPSLQIPWNQFRCDACPDSEKDLARLVYWLCQRPECLAELTTICVTCKEKNKGCGECGGHDFKQPYDYVDPLLGTSDKSMREFICRNLEQEHGELGLETKPADEIASKPPLSRLGRELVKTGGALDLARKLTKIADCNIGMARARLDLVHAAPSLEAALHFGDRLPASIAAVFDAGMRSIEEQPPDQRDLGLQAISGIAFGIDQRTTAADARNEQVAEAKCQSLVSFNVLNKWLEEAASLGPGRGFGSGPGPHHGLEDILHATRGFLVVIRRHPVDDLGLYHNDFAGWVAQGYDEALAEAVSEMQFGRLADVRDLARVQTFGGRKEMNRSLGLGEKPRKWSTAKEAEVTITEVPESPAAEEKEAPEMPSRPSFRRQFEQLPRRKLARITSTWID